MTTLSGIQYLGLSGISLACKEAIIRLVQDGGRVLSARLLSSVGTHCFLLTLANGELVAIKSGFASGYLGAGPTALSYCLVLLEAHGIEIRETEVEWALLERLDASALTQADLDGLERARPAPARWPDYILEQEYRRRNSGKLWSDFPAVMPFALIDPRLIDLAISFWQDPDARVMTAYRRLEDTIREQAGLTEHGARLFSQAFAGASPKLQWPGVEDAARGARAQLFTSVYGAHRNARAHKEPPHNAEQELSEFLLVNHLFRLQSEAMPAAAIAAKEDRNISPVPPAT